MKTRERKPALRPGLSLAEFTAYYWLQADLIRFARRLGLATQGGKPALTERIARSLRGARACAAPAVRPSGAGRDSDAPLTRATPVVNYKSDARTRAFFQSELGPGFHFTYYLNQFRLAHSGLSYGDLVHEWAAEQARRRDARYRAPIAAHGKYNRFIREFFADSQNTGASLADAAAAWTAVRDRRDGARYRRSRRSSQGRRQER